MRKKIMFSGMVAILGIVGMMAASLPSFAHSGGTASAIAGGRAGTDPADDTADPITSQVSAQHTANAGYHNTNMAQADILSWDVKRIDLPGGPGVEARWTVKGRLPDPDVITTPATNPYPSYNGYSFDLFFQNKAVQTNNPSSPRNRQCLRAAPGDIGQPDPRNHDADPNNNTYLYNPESGHWQDSYWWNVGISLSYSGGVYEATPGISYFYPGPDGGFSTTDLKANKYLNPGADLTNPYAGKGTYYDYSIIHNGANGPDTIVVKTVLGWTEYDGVCENPNWSATDLTTHEGPLRIDYVRPGETMSNISAKSWMNQLVILPTPIPLSALPEEFCELDLEDCANIEGIGGFITSADWSQEVISGVTVEDYDMGLAPYDQLNTDTGTMVGPTCWTPTNGGTLPRNPLWVDNQPCGIDNPIGPEYRLNNHNFIF